MISKNKANKSETKSCFVYITLPGQTQAVTAGRYELQRNKSGVALGRFIYSKKYLARPDKVELDPVELRLSQQTYETIRLKGVFGALRDAGPDYWGRRVIERHVGKWELNEMDYLLHSPEDRAGALGFGLNASPPAPKQKFNKTIDLPKLQNIANMLVEQEELPLNSASHAQVEELMLLGTSMGGARPKVVVEEEDSLWLAKFNRFDDKWNCARVEQAMLSLARLCGLNAAESKVVSIGNQDVLLVKRFDRQKTAEGYLRTRMISGLTLLQTEDTHQSRDKWSYILLAEQLKRISAESQNDVTELFRRMCFNALISNVDDHPRNHALIAKEHSWQLSPAYDLTPATPISLEQRDLAMIVGDRGRYANADNALSQCSRFFLEKEEAVSLIQNMEKRIKENWYVVARKEGVSERDCEAISSAFVYPGFRLTSHT